MDQQNYRRRFLRVGTALRVHQSVVPFVTGGTTVLLLAASLMAGTAVLAQAVVDTAVDTHISAHPQAPVTQQAEILNTANGRTQVNIQTPSTGWTGQPLLDIFES